jgi:hypothetical protein
MNQLSPWKCENPNDLPMYHIELLKIIMKLEE